MDSDEKYIAKKPKLPRKRKKVAIKAQGRDWYRKTILLYKITQKNGRFMSLFTNSGLMLP